MAISKPVLCVELLDGTSVKIDCKKLCGSPLKTLNDLQRHIKALLAPEYAGEIDARNLEIYDDDFERYVRLHDMEDLLGRGKGAVLRACRASRTFSNENVPLASPVAGAQAEPQPEPSAPPPPPTTAAATDTDPDAETRVEAEGGARAGAGVSASTPAPTTNNACASASGSSTPRRFGVSHRRAGVGGGLGAAVGRREA